MKTANKPISDDIFKPILFYLVLGSVAFFPCIIGGRVYFDGDLLNSNHILRQYLRDNLLHGHLPLWDPYLFGGQPFLADGDFMVCYPFLYLTLFFPVHYGFGIFYLTSFLIAALGMHLWLRALQLSEESCRVGALLFAFSGYFWWEIIHPPELAAFIWTPWWAACLEKTSERLKPVWCFAAGLVFAVLFTAGNFQLTMGALYGGVAYLGFRLFARQEWRKGPGTAKRLFTASLTFVAGAMPLLVFWIPAWEFMSRSDRLHAHLDYDTFQADYSLNPMKLLQFLFPVSPFTESGDTNVMDSYLANAGYLGPWAFFLMGLAFKMKKKSFVYFMAAAGAAALLIAFGKFFPLHRWACLWVPGIGLARAPFRYVFLYVAAGSVLAALGYETLKEGLEKGKVKRHRWVLLSAGIYGFAVACLSIGQGWKAWPQWLGLVLGLMAFYYLSRKEKRPLAPWIFLSALIPGLLISAWVNCTSRLGPASNFDFTVRCPALGKLKERTGLERVFIGDNVPYPVESCGQTIQRPLPSDVVCAEGLRSAAGYNPLNLVKVSELYSLPPQTFCRLMALGAFISGGEGWKAGGFSTEDWGGVLYLKNQEAVRFVYAPNHVETVGDNQQRLSLMRQPNFNPYETTYFSETLPVSMAGDQASPALLKYELKEDEPDQELFKISMNRPGWAVFSEIIYPGWKAWVDGIPTSLFTANHTFRAVWIPAGAHEVLFRYEPVWWKPLLAGLGLWFFSVLTVFLGPWRQLFFKGFRKK